MNGIERIIRFGNVFHNNKQQSSNSLFGDSIMPEIATPKLPSCEEWTLTENWILKRSDRHVYERPPVGSFQIRAEILRYYAVERIQRSERLSNAYSRQRQPQFRIAGLVVDAQHRVTKQAATLAF